MEKYLVTGSSGFIGGHLVEFLRSSGKEVHGLDRRAAHPNTDIVVDLADRDGLMDAVTALRPGKILHLAALGGVMASVEDPLPYVEVNVLGSAYLLEAARRVGVEKVVLVSSSSVYGDSPLQPLSEDLPCIEPLSPYAAGKRAMELLGSVYSRTYGLDVSVVRPFSVYGPNGRRKLVVMRFFEAALENSAAEVFGDGSAARDFTYVADVVRGIYLASQAAGWGVYNLGGGCSVEVNELLDMVRKVTGRDFKGKRGPERPGEIKRTFAAIKRADEVLGWQPEIGIEEGLERTWQWLVSTRGEGWKEH